MAGRGPLSSGGEFQSDISSAEGAAERMKSYALNVKNLEKLNTERKMSSPMSPREKLQAGEPMMNFLYRNRYLEDPHPPREGSRAASRGFRSVGRDESVRSKLSGYISPDLVSLDYDRESVNPIFSPRINKVSKYLVEKKRS